MSWLGMLPVVAEARVRSRFSSDEICDGENGISTSLKTSVLSVCINSLIFRPDLRPNNLSSERQVGEDYERRNNEMPSRTSWNVPHKTNFTLLVFRSLITFACNTLNDFLISSFRRVLYVLCFLLGDYPASGFYMPTFRNTLSVPSS